MDAYTVRRTSAIAGSIYLLSALVSLYLSAAGPIPIDGAGPADIPVLLLIFSHLVWAFVLLLSPPVFRRSRLRRAIFIPEALLAITAVFFLFTYTYALNANMDYVERFIEDTGVLRLALDTETERAIALIRFAPFFAANLVAYLVPRLTRSKLVALSWPGPRRRIATWSLLLVALSVVLQVAAFPSFVRLEGIAPLGWVALVPLFLVLLLHTWRRALFYGVFFGTALTLLSNFWLATFNLISLQFAVVLFFGFYVLYMVPTVALLKLVKKGRFLVLPLAWTVFEYLRSSGFLGYPFTLVAHSQYAGTALIQIASVTGVWGVSFLVLLVNSAIAETLLRYALFRNSGKNRGRSIPFERSAAARVLRPTGLALVTVAIVWVAGHMALVVADLSPEPERSVRVALVQQNTDPRQAQYRQTLSILRRLTDESLRHNPDIVAWSETAFVPNIRRWAAEDPPGSLTPIVLDMLEYQRSTRTWLLTGNDDYEVIRDLDRREIERNSYNAAVLFGDDGVRRETYRKIKLVPFTEYFPYRDLFPGVYELLQTFDVHLWEPGRERTVFAHPKFTFSTPICFEDVFPNEVRQFVLAGAEVILNLTNDYWSLTEVQAKQHFAAGMFRAVENRRQLLRSTASGLTAHVDPFGRTLETLPYYEEAYMVRDVPIADELPLTIYTRYGDWFVVAAAAVLSILAGLAVADSVGRPRSTALR